jgi:hypothetical protein
METPIQKAIKICDELLIELEVMSRTNYDEAQSRIEMVQTISGKIRSLVTDEKEMINQIYSNCEKIKAQQW